MLTSLIFTYTPMKPSIDINIKNGICTLKVSGIHHRPKDSYELMRLAGQVNKEKGCSSFIFDMREAKIISTTTSSTLDIVLNPEKHGLSNDFQIAVVYPKIQKDHLFMESIGISRGAKAFKIFENLDQAHSWICN